MHTSGEPPRALNTRSVLITAVARVFLSLVIISCAACGSGRLYDWGSYEPSMDRMYNAPESFRVEEEIRRLAEELEESQPVRVPPGKAAYLGYLYLAKSDRAAARAFFLMEKRLYPESESLMNRLLRTTDSREAAR